MELITIIGAAVLILQWINTHVLLAREVSDNRQQLSVLQILMNEYYNILEGSTQDLTKITEARQQVAAYGLERHCTYWNDPITRWILLPIGQTANLTWNKRYDAIVAKAHKHIEDIDLYLNNTNQFIVPRDSQQKQAQVHSIIKSLKYIQDHTPWSPVAYMYHKYGEPILAPLEAFRPTAPLPRPMPWPNSPRQRKNTA